MKVNLNVAPDDVGCCEDEYSGYVITDINVNEDNREVTGISYSYNWHCEDHCCSDTNYGNATIWELSDWLREWILEQMPGYHLQP